MMRCVAMSMQEDQKAENMRSGIEVGAARDEGSFLSKLERVHTKCAPVANKGLPSNDVAAEDLHAESRERSGLANERDQAVELAHAAVVNVAVPCLTMTLYGLHDDVISRVLGDRRQKQKG